jgi:hypothetical protein
MIIKVNQNAYKHILELIKTSKDKLIPIIRYKPIIGINEGDIIKIRPSNNVSRLKGLTAKVVKIVEYNVEKDELPYDELIPIYGDFVFRIHKVPRIFIMYVKILSIS